jgi:hypothetical protein
MTLLMMFASAARFEAEPPPPSNGPAGGASWLRGRRAPFADEVLDLRPKPPRRRDRAEILLLKP